MYTYIGKICADPLNVDTKCEREGRSTVLSRPAAHHWPPGWQSCPTSLTQASADDHIIQTRHAICKKILSVDVPQRGVGEFTHHSLHHCHGCCCTSSGPDPQAGTFRLTAYHVLMNVFSGTLVIPKNHFFHPPRPSLLRTVVENSKSQASPWMLSCRLVRLICILYFMQVSNHCITIATDRKNAYTYMYFTPAGSKARDFLLQCLFWVRRLDASTYTLCRLLTRWIVYCVVNKRLSQLDLAIGGDLHSVLSRWH